MKFSALLIVAFVALTLAQPSAHADVAIIEVRFGEAKETKRIVIDLFESDAPATVENFKRLARKGFYKGVAFHRAIPNYLVQTGDPLSRRKDRTRVGTGGPGYTLPAETKGNVETGSVAMGRLPDKINPTRASNGSQFFIVLNPAEELEGHYTVFGKVVEGIEVAESISKQSVDSNDYPVERITIRSVRIAESAPGPDAAPKRTGFLSGFFR
jgi:peptidyl-prolyl cis-trans isomerase B (cyclophilin B)